MRSSAQAGLLKSTLSLLSSIREDILSTSYFVTVLMHNPLHSSTPSSVHLANVTVSLVLSRK